MAAARLTAGTRFTGELFSFLAASMLGESMMFTNMRSSGLCPW
jgi:hypothetical protein